MCPIVPIFRCGLLRSNFSFAIAMSAPQLVRSLESSSKISPPLLTSRPTGRLCDHFLGDRIGGLGIMREMHRKTGAALRAAAHVGGISEHLGQRNFHANHV